MVRYVALILAFLAVPSIASAQEARSHTVVRGNTLWSLAQQYYGNSREWPKIYEANRDVIANPNRIAPGQVIMIPGVAAVAAAAPPMEIVVQPGPPGLPPTDTMPPTVTRPAVFEPTVFSVVNLGTTVRPAPPSPGVYDVAPHEFYSAAWLIPPATVPEHSGTLASLSGGEDANSTRTSLATFDRVDVRITGAVPAVGSRLQAFRVDRDIKDVGQVITPTATLRVEATSAGGVVAVVESAFTLIQLGDLVRPLPSYAPRRAGTGVPVNNGTEATVLGFAEVRQVQAVGNSVFLDVGATEGVNIGDEYVVTYTDTPDFPARVEGRVKVTAVLQNSSTARIISLSNPVFLTGVKLRPVLRVP
jgi:LysM repeat protein